MYANQTASTAANEEMSEAAVTTAVDSHCDERPLRSCQDVWGMNGARSRAPGRDTPSGDASIHAVSRADAPSGIRTRATTLKGWRPGPLVDGGGRARGYPCPELPSVAAGRLAQLVERLPYTQVAAGSSPAPPTRERPGNPGLSFSRVTAKGYAKPRWSTDWSTRAFPKPIEASESRTRSRSSASRNGFA
jgi:hypothetical protein